jgi:hypothetical protein
MFSSLRSSAGYKRLFKLVNQYLRATFVLTRIPKVIEEGTLLDNNVRDQTRFEPIAQTFFETQDLVRHPWTS